MRRVHPAFALVPLLAACATASRTSGGNTANGDHEATASRPQGVDAFGVPIPPSSPTTAVAASNFLASIGMNIGKGSENPGLGIADATYASSLQYLGVRWVRGGSNTKTFGNHLAISRLSGIKMSYQTWCRSAETVDGTDIVNAAALADAGLLLFLEGTNEPDNFTIKWNDAAGGGTNGNWLPVAECQQHWYAAIKANPKLAHYAVANITHSGAENQNVGLQWLTIPEGAGAPDAPVLMPEGTRYADYATMHNYMWFANGNSGVVSRDNLAWNAAAPTTGAGTTNEPFAKDYVTTYKKKYRGYSSADAPSVPRITTETGWQTGRIEGARDASDETGKLLLNTFLDQFARGYSLTAWYQLFDGDGGDTGDTFGLYRVDTKTTPPVTTPKAGATYLHNMTSILGDSGNSFAPGTLAWSIASPPPTVHALLLQKTDGHFWLCLTDEHWNAPATPDTVALSLGKIATVKTYDPTVGTTSVKTETRVRAVALTMTDHPLFLEIY